MAPYTNIPLSPAELSYIHTSLSQTPPIRPDGRSPTQFRPLVAETDILPSANGSARICFADGTEAVVGVKAEVEKSRASGVGASGEVAGEGVRGLSAKGEDVDMDDEPDGGVSLKQGDEEDGNGGRRKGKGQEGWVEVSIEIPGMRDDDSMPMFLAAMLVEALTADGELKDRLWINNRFHWRVYVDVCPRSRLLLHNIYCIANNNSPDPAPLAATLIPPPLALIDDTSGPPLHPTTSSHIRKGRRPALQRRLGSLYIPLSPQHQQQRKSQHQHLRLRKAQTTHHPPGDERRREHHLRPQPRRTRRRGRRACHLRGTRSRRNHEDGVLTDGRPAIETHGRGRAYGVEYYSGCELALGCRGFGTAGEGSGADGVEAAEGWCWEGVGGEDD